MSAPLRFTASTALQHRLFVTNSAVVVQLDKADAYNVPIPVTSENGGACCQELRVPPALR